MGTGNRGPVGKGIVGSGNRKSRVLGGETSEQYEKRIVGSGWAKTAGETRAQSPKSNGSIGGGPWTPKKKINK